jgi:hypothetical protein
MQPSVLANMEFDTLDMKVKKLSILKDSYEQYDKLSSAKASTLDSVRNQPITTLNINESEEAEVFLPKENDIEDSQHDMLTLNDVFSKHLKFLV